MRRRGRRPPPPLPPRDGLDAAQVRMPAAAPPIVASSTSRNGSSGPPPNGCAGPPWETVAQFLRDRTGDPEGIERRLADGEICLGDGTVVTCATAYRAGQSVYLYRDLPVEVPVPGRIEVLHRDDRIVVVDKPHFLATTPRGVHVAQTVLVRMRCALDLPGLAPAHRLDRLTAGVLMLTVEASMRGAYQSAFARGEVTKTYLAIAPVRPDLPLPLEVSDRLAKPRGSLQTLVVDGPPNARTRIELLEQHGDLGLYRLRPSTGQTHQLRVHLSGLGIPILGDPLYPKVRGVAPDDFSDPLQLLASELSFTDPFSSRWHRFTSRRSLRFDEVVARRAG